MKCWHLYGDSADGPIRNIINTSQRDDHTGGTWIIRFAGTNVGNTGSRGRYDGATVMATENVLTWMSMQTGDDEIHVSRWPTDVYFTDSMELVLTMKRFVFASAGSCDEWRQHRLLSRIRCRQYRRYFLNNNVSGNRSTKMVAASTASSLH